VRAVVSAVEHDRVVGDTEFVKQGEELPDVHIMFDHAVGVLVLS